MKYRIQKQERRNGRNHWKGVEAVEWDNDHQAAVYMIQAHDELDVPVRLLDSTDSVICVYTQNSAKF